MPVAMINVYYWVDVKYGSSEMSLMHLQIIIVYRYVKSAPLYTSVLRRVDENCKCSRLTRSNSIRGDIKSQE